jgi:serine/threonine-protein kinase
MNQQAPADETLAQLLPSDPLDAGLAAAFGPDSGPPLPAGDSVLKALGAVLRQPPRLHLRPPDAGDDAPIVRPRSPEMPEGHDPTGRLQLHGEIARGGMGAILQGRDTDLGRDVAVKVLLEAHAGKAELLQRFVEEAQIAGQLQHPGVVPVYELGQFPDRRPYFIMKLVKGQTLARLLAGRSSPAQDRARFLGIFLQACQAVAYAHARGVIHRDLKPSNVMVGSFGEVQVMDWGLAKVVGQPGRGDPKASQDGSAIRTVRSTSAAPGPAGTNTQAGSVLGTPAYMPPEQARGDVNLLDERCDVFGLGAILCEILTGQPPYGGDDAEAAFRRAAHGDLGDAHARLERSGADPELIALAKDCLAPAAEDRPRDAGVLAAQMTAYLEGVEARLRRAELERAEAQGRAAEERKRRRTQLALAATVVLALAGAGAAGLWYQRDRAERAADQARRAAETERDVSAALQEAAVFLKQARGLTDDPVRWEAALTTARAAARRADGLLARGDAGKDLPQRVRATLAALDEADRDRQVVVALEEARLAQAQGPRDGGGFDMAAGGPLFDAAFRAYGIDVRRLPPAEAARLVRSSAVREALIAALETWALTTRRGADQTHLLTIVPLADADPASFRNRLAAAALAGGPALKRLAAEGEVRSLPAGALVNLAGVLSDISGLPEAESLLRRAQRRFPADFWVNHQLAWTLARQGKPRHAEAVGYYRVALALRPHSPGVRLNLGAALRESGQPKDAEEAYRKAMRLGGRSAMVYCNLGIALADQGRFREAEEAGRTGTALDPRYARGHYNLGVIFLKQKKWNEAEQANRAAIRLQPKYAPAHNNLGRCLTEQGRPREAETVCREALRLDGSNPRAHYNLAIALAAQDRPGEAEASYRAALAIEKDYADAHGNLGILLRNQRRLTEAETHFRLAVRAAPESARNHFNLGLVLTEQQKFAEAEVEYRDVLRIDPHEEAVQFYLGKVLSAQRKFAGAEAAYRAAIAFKQELGGAHYGLGYVLYRQGKWKDAEAAYREAIRLDGSHAAAHCELAFVLKMQGQIEESLTFYRSGHTLGSSQPGWMYPSERWLKEAEELAVLDRKLAKIKEGKAVPADAAERLALAALCHVCKKLPRTAVRFYAEAFAADPNLAGDLRAQHRYGATCSAVLAAAGQGEDAQDLPDKERQSLRRQALVWLRADLALYAQTAGMDELRGLKAVRQRLEHWGQNRELAPVRDAAALERLPEDERAAWGQLWADTADLLVKVGGKK